jgi:hypothetical protein
MISPGLPDGLPDFMASEASLDALIAGFEDGTWPKGEWTHAAHLAAGAHYILENPDTALDRLRSEIPRYNVRQGGANTEDSGYHETLTCFWHGVIRDFIGTLPAGLDRLAIVRAVVTEFAPKRDLFREYYDFDVVNSREARLKWIPPGSGRAEARPQGRSPGPTTL